MQVNYKRALLAIAASFGLSAASAQTYPDKPIRMISAFAPSGATATIARILAEEMGKQLKQNVLVEDKPGASGVIAARAAMAAPADGYTLHIGGLNPHPLVLKNGVDLLTEMEPLGVAADLPLLFVTTTAKPLKTVADVVAYAKANPGRLDFASAAGGAELNLIMALFANRAGMTFTHIPFRSSGEIQTALGRGDVHITLLTATSAKPLITSNKANPVLIGTPARLDMYPDVPTPKDMGYKPFTSNTIIGLWAPKGTPPDVIRKLSAALINVQKDPKYIENFKARTGIAPVGLTPEQTREFFASKVSELEEAIRLTGFKPE